MNMIQSYVFTIGAIMLALLIYVVVQRLYQLFRQRHPELGPFRVEGKGCGGSGSCSGDGRCGGGGC